MENTLAKIAITSASDEALMKSLDRVNDGFEGGRVNKSDLASWLILRGINSLDSVGVEEVRKTHFSPVKYLEILLRKLKTSGREKMEPAEIERLQLLLGQGVARRQPKKPSPPQKVSTASDATVKPLASAA
jgi:hypothetical protein